jgi:Flp pilus assembly protein TadD
MTTAEYDLVAEFKQGIELLKSGRPQSALFHMRRVFESEQQNPYYLSFLGLSIARAEHRWDQAAEFCEIALKMKRNNCQFHLNLAEVYTLAGRQEDALETLDRALLQFRGDLRLKRARSRIEKRRAPVLSFLARGHFLNRTFGRLRHGTLQRLGK